MFLILREFTERKLQNMAKKQESPSKILSDAIVKALKEKKGIEITRLDLRSLNGAVTDYYVIATGSSDRHVQALSEYVIEAMEEFPGEKPHSKEGIRAGEWALLDYVSVVVHIFQEEKRFFYSIEELWGDAKREDFDKKKK